MAKHAFTCLFLFIFTHFSTAQLILQRLDGKGKHVIPAGHLIDMSFPTKTVGLPEKASQIYQGYLKSVNGTGVDIVLTYENRHFSNEIGVEIDEKKEISKSKTPITTKIPTTKMRYMTHYFERSKKVANAGAVILALAVVSNIFIAPHLKAPHNKTFRNAGYIVMGVGLSTALVPTKKKYYFEQPENGKETLWKLSN